MPVVEGRTVAWGYERVPTGCWEVEPILAFMLLLQQGCCSCYAAQSSGMTQVPAPGLCLCKLSPSCFR